MTAAAALSQVITEAFVLMGRTKDQPEAMALAIG